MNELTPEEWQYISVLIVTDIRNDMAKGLDILVAKHTPIWEKIQPYCRWDDETSEDQE